MSYRPHLLVPVFVALLSIVATPGQALQGEDPPGEPPPYVLLPHDWPYPALPTCSTHYGICRYPHNFPAGTPCYCLARSGGWVPGYISVNPVYPPAEPAAPPPPPRREPGSPRPPVIRPR